jgi:hypothetical protein
MHLLFYTNHNEDFSTVLHNEPIINILQSTKLEINI